MIDQNIGNPEITRKHLSEMQTFYEAQLVAKRHYDALMTSLKPLQDAADVLRGSGVVNVDALLSQPVSATKAMIDEMEADADELNDLTQPAPAPEGFIPWEGGPNPFREMTTSELDKLIDHQGAWCGFERRIDERLCTIVQDEDLWNHSYEHKDCWITALKLPEGYELVDAEGGKVVRKIDHFAEATAQIEAQAEPESTETEAELPEWTLLTEEEKAEGWKQVEFTGEPPEGIEDWTNYEVLFGVRHVGPEQTQWGWHRGNLLGMEGNTIIGYRLKPDTAETMQAIAQAVEAVDAEPEAVDVEPETPATPDETVTEQPEAASDDVEAEIPSQPEEPKAERKSYDFTGDFTQEEILAQSGATASVVESQPDDIAATERAEFDAPQRQFYNPWAKTEKAEG